MYVLDTDICSYLMKRTHPALIERVKAFVPRDLKVSVITLFELEYGILRSDRRDSLRRVVRAFLENVELLAWTDAAAREAGAVRAELAATGRPIGAYDLQIAGHARSLGAILVTNNLREFSRVPGLRLEDWVGGAMPPE
ncbi:MAG TPA: type II toxin-antitoxin system VapC family toxin [Thermoanaerobaculia bacterium]|jgi:tRNA(fMet)-specific endonuclease VapC|nr:type II toxin-antitoxin system VapC family toxin [Thermoanaerobaculia bacterium]